MEIISFFIKDFHIPVHSLFLSSLRTFTRHFVPSLASHVSLRYVRRGKGQGSGEGTWSVEERDGTGGDRVTNGIRSERSERGAVDCP